RAILVLHSFPTRRSSDLRQLVLTIPDVNVSDQATNQTALAYAIENGNREMVRTLLGAGADINARSRDGQTALMSLNGKANVDLRSEEHTSELQSLAYLVC